MKKARNISLTAVGLVVGLGLVACSSPGTTGQTVAATPSETAVAAGTVDPIEMPTGSVPEGIAIDGSTAYVTSFADGTVFAVDLITGQERELSPATGTGSVGIMLDGKGHLFVAGGFAGTIRVLDQSSGEELASYSAPTKDSAVMVNDFAVLDGALYATDSLSPVLYRLPLNEAGGLPEEDALEVIDLTGMTFDEGFNSNGIVTTPDEKDLVVVQTNTGGLFRVDEKTGQSTPIALEGIGDLTTGDGMLREDNKLYVVRNLENSVAVLDLDDAGTTATLTKEITDPAFDSPTTIARMGDRFYLPNARFTLANPKNEDFAIVSVEATS